MADNKSSSKPSITDKAKSAGDMVTGWALLAPGEAARASGRMSKGTLAWWGIALGAVILLSLNVISSSIFKNAATDLTDTGLYTISDSTRRVLSKIEEPIDVKIYFSERLGELSAQYKRYFGRVRALFERYEGLSGGKLRVSFINPEAFSDAEDRAVAGGLSGVRLGGDGENGYFGLVATNSTDDREVVQFFTPQREPYLEYDMTKLVHKLSVAKKPVIGLMAGIQIQGGMTPQRQQLPPWMINEQIGEFFEVETVSMSTKEIPEKIDVLMLVHPIALTKEAAFAIDQFVLRGGRLLAFLDPVSEIGRMTNPALGGGIENPELSKLLKAWGVKFDPTKIVGDIATARRVQTGGAGGQVFQYVAWQGIREAGIDGKAVVADGVKTLNIATPGHIEAIDKATTKLQPIVLSSPRAMLIDAKKVSGYAPDPAGLLRDYKIGGKTLVLAGRVTGKIKTAFPDGLEEKKDDKTKAADGKDAKDAAKKDDAKKDAAKAATDDKAKEAAKPQRKEGEINAIIFADADMLYDEFWVRTQQVFGQRMVVPTAHNGAFVINALENLSGGEALKGLRGRGVDNRPFDLVEDIRRDADRNFRQKEQALVSKLEKLQADLSKVERSSGVNGATSLVLSDADQQKIENFRSEMVETRRELRNVKHALRADIESLEGWVKFLNIALVPLLIGAGGLAMAAMRRRRKRA